MLIKSKACFSYSFFVLVLSTINCMFATPDLMQSTVVSQPTKAEVTNGVDAYKILSTMLLNNAKPSNRSRVEESLFQAETLYNELKASLNDLLTTNVESVPVLKELFDDFQGTLWAFLQTSPSFNFTNILVIRGFFNDVRGKLENLGALKDSIFCKNFEGFCAFILDRVLTPGNFATSIKDYGLFWQEKMKKYTSRIQPKHLVVPAALILVSAVGYWKSHQDTRPVIDVRPVDASGPQGAPSVAIVTPGSKFVVSAKVMAKIVPGNASTIDWSDRAQFKIYPELKDERNLQFIFSLLEEIQKNEDKLAADIEKLPKKKKVAVVDPNAVVGLDAPEEVDTEWQSKKDKLEADASNALMTWVKENMEFGNPLPADRKLQEPRNFDTKLFFLGPNSAYLWQQREVARLYTPFINQFRKAVLTLNEAFTDYGATLSDDKSILTKASKLLVKSFFDEMTALQEANFKSDPQLDICKEAYFMIPIKCRAVRKEYADEYIRRNYPPDVTKPPTRFMEQRITYELGLRKHSGDVFYAGLPRVIIEGLGGKIENDPVLTPDASRSDVPDKSKVIALTISDTLTENISNLFPDQLKELGGLALPKKGLKPFTELQALSLKSDHMVVINEINDEMFEGLGKLKELQFTFNLDTPEKGGFDIRHFSATPFQHLKSLERLLMTRCTLPAIGKDMFVGLEKLKELNLKDCRILGEIDPEAFKNLKNLRSLQLFGTKISDDVYEKIKDNLSSLCVVHKNA